MTVPGFWRNEHSGVLCPVVHAYLRGEGLNPVAIGVMRDYLRQWVMAPGFHGPQIDMLRASVDKIGSDDTLEQWMDAAVDAGIDPL